jgi:hypothetical protein
LNSEDINDAELDAFLKGEDELSRRLKALEQPSPSAQLDAAILAQAARPAAANDVSAGAGANAPMQRLGLRWRVPAGIAATVLAGVLAHQAWQASTDLDRAREVGDVAPVLSPPPPDRRFPEAIEPVPPIAAKPTPEPSKSSRPAARRIEPQAVEPSPAPAPPPPPPPVESYRYAAPPAPIADEPRAVEITGRRSRVDVPAPAPASAAKLSERAAQPDPKIWLAAIEEMIKAGLQRDALEEWDKFRAAWPDYPVAPETREKINALRK